MSWSSRLSVFSDEESSLGSITTFVINILLEITAWIAPRADEIWKKSGAQPFQVGDVLIAMYGFFVLNQQRF
jgi:hypothetical protein